MTDTMQGVPLTMLPNAPSPKRAKNWPALVAGGVVVLLLAAGVALYVDGRSTSDSLRSTEDQLRVVKGDRAELRVQASTLRARVGNLESRLAESNDALDASAEVVDMVAEVADSLKLCKDALADFLVAYTDEVETGLYDSGVTRLANSAADACSSAESDYQALASAFAGAGL